MRHTVLIIAASLALIVPVTAQQNDTHPAAEQPVRFAPLHVYIDSGDNALAAYQFELEAVEGDVKIVGVEGGDHAAFAQPAYYDPKALSNNRIIIAAFSTAEELPSGKTRVATIHLQITGDTEPKYNLKLTVAGDPDGNEIPAKITGIQGDQK